MTQHKFFILTFPLLLSCILSFPVLNMKALAEGGPNSGDYLAYCYAHPSHKMLHVGSTFVIYTLVYQAGGRTGEAQTLALLSAMGAGLAKESMDLSLREPLVNGLGDLFFWDAAGTALGFFLEGSPIVVRDRSLALKLKF